MKRRIPETVAKVAMSESLRRCVVPSCRTRVGLRLVRLAHGVSERGHFAPLCRDCLAGFRRGEFSTHQLQRWKLRGVDYWENVGAE